PPPMQMPAMEAHHINALTGEDEMAIAEINSRIAGGEFSAAAAAAPPAAAPKAARDPRDPSTWGKVGRNEPCPCGSGKKYKHCHGMIA
ncbi:MAG: SEC-C domain-containing protein, partial [Methylobacteriaceae bacterium]|nr:SEC-C domain-containing protein [Methylobacteriaceae bacterium]